MCVRVVVQVFAYLLLSASAAGTSMARTLKEMETCRASNAFCVQTDIAIALGYAAFLFLGFTSLLTGFRVVSFIINGSRFHLWGFRFRFAWQRHTTQTNEYFGWGRAFLFTVLHPNTARWKERYQNQNYLSRACSHGVCTKAILFFLALGKRSFHALENVLTLVYVVRSTWFVVRSFFSKKS